MPGFIARFMEQVLTRIGSQGQTATNNRTQSNGSRVGEGSGTNNNSIVRNLFSENQTTSAYSNTSAPFS